MSWSATRESATAPGGSPTATGGGPTEAADPAGAAGRLERACGGAERALLRLRLSPNGIIVVRGTFGFLKQLLRSRALERPAPRPRG